MLSTPFLAAVLAIFTWPIASIGPGPGLDASWQAALYMGVEGGMQFGRELVFTYGPLGFLHAPVLYGESLWLLAFAYHALSWFGLALTLVWVARRALLLPVAVGVCFLVLVVGHLAAVTVLIAFLWCFAALAAEPPPFTRPLLVYGGAALAAAELLGKVNYGVSILVLCLVALLSIPGRRANLPRFVVTLAAVLVTLWLLAGQAPANLPDYFENSWQFVSGYSRAMGTDLGTVPWEIPLALAAAAVLIAAAAFATRGEPIRVRVGSLLLLALFVYVSFKQDFVRSGPDGRTEFAVLMTAAALAVGARFGERSRRPRIDPRLLGAGLVAPMLALLVWVLPSPSFWGTVEPGPHLNFLREDLHAFLSPSARAAVRSDSREGMRSTYRLPASIRQRIGARPVAVEPWEVGVAWAYGLDWQPLPVIQDYAVYTPGLDRLNAAALAADGPTTILRQPTRGENAAIVTDLSGRYPAWEAPAATLALLCHYRAALTTPRWQLLERSDRCGAERALATVHTETGVPLPVPPAPGPGEVVFARVHGLGLTAPEAATALLYRAPRRSVSFDGGRDWTVTEATASDGLILRVPAAADFPRPFQLAPDPASFSFEIDGAGTRPLEVEFFAQRIRD